LTTSKSWLTQTGLALTTTGKHASGCFPRGFYSSL
jgi:hypothetical protein